MTTFSNLKKDGPFPLYLPSSERKKRGEVEPKKEENCPFEQKPKGAASGSDTIEWEF